MQNKIIILCSLLLVSGAVPAQQSLLNSAAQTLESAQGVEQNLNNAPALLKQQAEGAALQKLDQAVPVEALQGIETANQLKSKADSLPTSTDTAVNAVEGQAKQKAAEKALDLLR